MMKITVNSEDRDVADGTRVRSLGTTQDTFILNGNQVAEDKDPELRDDDEVEITRKNKSLGQS